MLRRIGQIRLKTILWALLGIIFLLTWVGNVVGAFQEFQASLDIPKADPKRRELLKALQEISERPASEKRESLLFIPQSYKLYWKWYGNCQASPFIAPAITGMALLDGLPSAQCEAIDYGYASYKLRSPTLLPLQAKNTVGICHAAQQRGFAKVIVLDANQRQEPQVRSLDCRP